MNKQTRPSQLNRLHLVDDQVEHPFLEWLSQHRQTILYVFIACLAVFIIAYRYLSNQTAMQESAYFQAEVEIKRFQDQTLSAVEPSANQEVLDNLKKIIQEYPDLQAKYDGLVAQLLIIDGKMSEVEGFASRTFQRLENIDSPYYLDFAKTSLTIGQGQYAQAYQQAFQLKEKMVADAENALGNSENVQFGATLFAFNLLRLALLQQQLGHSDEELRAWKELQEFTLTQSPKASLINPSKIQEALSSFSEGNASIWNFIENRKKALTATK